MLDLPRLFVTQEQTNWHHLFGLMIKDFLTGTPCEVELEWDLSVKSQFLDVLIVRKTAAVIDRILPDGLEGNLAEHNLITFGSLRGGLGNDDHTDRGGGTAAANGA